MPYIIIKTIKKNDAVKQAAVEKLMEIFPEIWDCPKEAVSISIEEYATEEFQEKVAPELNKQTDSVWVYHGEHIVK